MKWNIFLYISMIFLLKYSIKILIDYPLKIYTCVNQLQLSDYPYKEILYERLTLTIREGKYGFAFVYFGINTDF